MEESREAPGGSYAELARRIQITRPNLILWHETGLRALPTQANLRSVAATIGRPYRQGSDAVPAHTGYVPASVPALLRWSIDPKRGPDLSLLTRALSHHT